MHRTASPLLVSLCAASPEAVALCAAMPLPAGDGAPEWINLLPSGATITTVDGRGPYRVPDPAALVRVSLQQAAGPMVIDENHATDLAAPNGQSAPARGWIVDLQARADGIWGKVEWTPAGLQLMADRAYRYISPVISHRKDGTVLEIRRASLVNKPNLRGMVALQQEIDMDLLQKLLAALGLPAETTADQIVEKITALHAEQSSASTALQSAMAPIAAAVGLQADADQAAVLAGVEKLKAGGGSRVGDPVVTALQSEIATLATKLKTLEESGTRTAAEAYVDGEIKRGRAGLNKLMRDDYIALHMEDPARAQKLIGGMPILGGGGQIVPPTPPAANGEISLNAEQTQAAKLLGLDPKTYAETIKAEREAAL